MEAKNCIHLKDGIGIDRNFLKMQKLMKRVENKFECLGKIFFLYPLNHFIKFYFQNLELCISYRKKIIFMLHLTTFECFQVDLLIIAEYFEKIIELGKKWIIKLTRYAIIKYSINSFKI